MVLDLRVNTSQGTSVYELSGGGLPCRCGPGGEDGSLVCEWLASMGGGWEGSYHWVLSEAGGRVLSWGEWDVDALFFSNSYATHGVNLVEDRIVAIRGRVDKREEQPRISALDLTLPDLKLVPTGPLIISMEASRCTPPIIDKMSEILKSHPGAREVHLRLIDGEKKTILKLDEALKVTSSPGLSADLKTVLGPDCLVV